MGDGRIKAGVIVGLTCIMAMFCLPLHASAFGFGALELNSHLNEPINAQVPLLLADSEKMKHIKVEMASAAEYRQMGLPWHDRLSLIRLAIEGKDSASPVVVLNSSGVITSPILSIVLKARKEGRGTYYRHYQLLMDPVEIAALHDVSPKVESVLSAQETLPVVNPASASNDDSDWARVRRYGPVRAGDNLSEIAYRLRKDKRYSNRQVMLSLYEKNPDSFVGGSINHLKKGSWLNVPTGEVVKSYASSDAMGRLSRLLQPVAESKPKAVALVADSEVVQQPGQPQQELRYSGKINFSAANDELVEYIQNAVRKESDVKLETIHQQLMSGKLQMSEMSQTVAQLDVSMQGIKEDVKSIKDDVKILKLQAQSPANGPNNYWLMGLLGLLAALIGLLTGLMLKRPKKQQIKVTHDTASVKKTAQVAEVEEKPELKAEVKVQPSALEIELRPSDAVDALLNNIEESLGQCHFEDAEAMLTRVDPLAPDSLRAAVLRAQLYHETGRQDECNTLINRMSESSDKKRWESFCHMLPGHVWQSCFGDGISTHE